jgi:serpin B
MQLTGGQEVPYLRGDGWQATELRYWGSDRTTPLAMTLVLPDDLAAFQSNLSAAQLDQIASDLRAERQRLVDDVDNGAKSSCGTYPYSLNLYMPRFGLETRAELRKALATLGMPAAFDPGRADFTGIHKPEFDGDSVFIANVIHQANIDVDELGTEAAAATAVGMDTAGCGGPAPAEERTFRLDRPFFFALRDVETGAVLFLGRVVDPSLEN